MMRYNLLKYLSSSKIIWSNHHQNNLIAVFTRKKNFYKSYSSNHQNTDSSEKITKTLRVRFPLAKQINVVDISGGCGSMYEIFVESVEFKGLSTVKQHRLINETLKEDIKQMHGLRIQTQIPEEN